jgi:uncharacterized protein (TIGR04255 family)
MSESVFPQLKTPPITEAIFEILFKIEDGFNVNDFELFRKKFSSEYVRADEINVFEGVVNAKISEAQNLKSERIGYLLLNESKSKAIQIRKNGFAFSISNNSYKNWDEFKGDALAIFTEIKSLYKIKEVVRTSLRYINSIDLPTDLVDIKEHITIAPEIPKKLNLGLSKMFMQITIPNHEKGATGIVTQAFDAGFAKEKTFSFVLDIDVQILKEYKMDEAKIMSDFETLRMFKNEIFFNSVTEKTIDTFQK